MFSHLHHYVSELLASVVYYVVLLPTTMYGVPTLTCFRDIQGSTVNRDLTLPRTSVSLWTNDILRIMGHFTDVVPQLGELEATK